MGPGADGSGGPGRKYQSKWTSLCVTFTSSLSSLPQPLTRRMALISGCTGDNPRLLSEAIAQSCKCIMPKNPRAPTVT